MSIKKPIENGKSYYEVIPCKLGGVILAISNYGKVIYTDAFPSIFKAEQYVQDNFRKGGIL